MNLKTLHDAALYELKDIFSAEKQLVKALPKMIKQANHPDLKRAFEQHLHETEQHVDRIKQAFEKLGKSARAETCEGMRGLIEESEELLDQQAEPHVLDAELIAQAQKIEHYEIASYGTLCTWLDQLGEQEAAQLCKQNMADEEETDKKLTELAKATVNVEAAMAH